MGEKVELGETGVTGDMIQTGELGRVSQVIGELGVPGIVAGKLGEGGVSTGERGEGAISTGERGKGAVGTGERGEGAVGTGEGTSGASERWLVPAKRWNKRKCAMKDKGGQTGRLEDPAAGTDTSDCESMSDCGELSSTVPDRQDFDTGREDPKEGKNLWTIVDSFRPSWTPSASWAPPSPGTLTEEAQTASQDVGAVLYGHHRVLLTSSITVWYAGATARDRLRLQRVVRAAEKVIGCRLPSIQDLYISRTRRRAGRRLRSIRTKTSRYMNSFFPSAIRLLNTNSTSGHSTVDDDPPLLSSTRLLAASSLAKFREWEGQALLSHNTTLSGGVGLLFSRGFTPLSLEVEHVVRGRCLLVKVRLQNHALVFINIYAPTIGQWWDRGKLEIQLLCQQYTLNATQDTCRSIKDLETEIVELEAIGSSTGDRGCIEILQSKKMALASLLDNQVKGALVRSLIQDITEMDNPSRFFFGLEKKRVEPGQIRQRAVEFFSSLYDTEYCGDDGLFDEFCEDLPWLSEETNSRLDRPLRLDKLHAALLSMKGRKSPGVDGLTVEFFKAFWDIVVHDMLKVFNESLPLGSLPLSCRRGAVTLLPKKGNLQVIKNWCPVSLQCMDYRILSKTLASRLREAMEQVIQRDQTYCVPGTSITRKSFDRVQHKFLWKVMKRFRFSPGFIAMTRVLYCDIASLLKFNGSLCAPFRPGSTGTRVKPWPLAGGKMVCRSFPRILPGGATA
ncbi:Transposon TX1 uncharacterized 149 kDa protein ORF 2 [Takifugu flavidus]|uniref:Transposon TX1 uncharacterized 149 kDa protein ORF 2 n=1 Tax=Takifugu flavidus TaxID=433684 RepID=A0A5C6NXQ7_9TELE|nr:Transposon TX1 uncharacterized 149 kDa protein ORF 2 [Takifugu flavidus]